LNAFQISSINISIFFLETVAGVKKVFTFALPTTTTYSLTETESRDGNHQHEMISLQGRNK